MAQDDYHQRVTQQIEQYADRKALIGLPSIYRYWTQKYLTRKVNSVFGSHNIVDAYANSFVNAYENARSESANILSIGCGDANVEIEILSKMIARGCKNIKLVATELSPVRIERAEKNVIESGLQKYVEILNVDVNSWKPNLKFSGIMAQHTLHHVVNLEGLFLSIHEMLEPNGVFFVVDMIGRNGHMRWPETLEIVEKFWLILPEKYKFNHQFGKVIDPYLNWDCSKKGFEGIRSQDILALLCENFQFSHFLGAGGFVDIFVDRGYGHNFSENDEIDRAYIDIIATMNDAMLEARVIKPTMIFAICRRMDAFVERLSTFNGHTAHDAIRVPD